MPGLDLPPVPTASGAYRVLARKYRPQTFAELIGQEAMVQTLANAIRRGRIAHAFLMTGVRGVGKTSTARLIAKALNCIGPDGSGGPTIDPCGVCEPCRAIAEGRHIDVVEMDAASNRGIDDARELKEAVRYLPASARYKLYIIDEVHMLTKEAFNALLKTLEEPPAHVKFVLATTEVAKLPVTILSRCQRFDLRRIPAPRLAEHFAAICGREQVCAEPDALMLIARAAEGSARDGLSLLDQAIAHADMAGGSVTADAVRTMLGVADGAAVGRLFAALVGGDVGAMLGELGDQRDLGVEPLATLTGLLGQVHAVTLARAGAAPDPALDDMARAQLATWADRLSTATLHRLWQLLLKGYAEVRDAAMPDEACTMALLRVMHAASLPDPDDLARRLASLTPGATPPGSSVDPAPTAGSAAEASLPASLEALLALLAPRYPRIEAMLRDTMRPIAYAPPHIRFAWAGPVPPGLLADLRAALLTVTGVRWTLEEGTGDAAPTLTEQAATAQAASRAALLDTPVVRAVMAAFPDARLIDDTPSTHSDERSARA